MPPRAWVKARGKHVQIQAQLWQPCGKKKIVSLLEARIWRKAAVRRRTCVA